jgi:putative redox protein
MSTLKLTWQGLLKFANEEGSPAIELHSSTPGITSPTQALGYAVMACMGMDVVHILQKGRHTLHALSVGFEGTRAAEHPRRYTKIHLHFEITGDVPDEAVTRAIEVSHSTYCSVSNSLRTDIEFTTSFVVRRADST